MASRLLSSGESAEFRNDLTGVSRKCGRVLRVAIFGTMAVASVSDWDLKDSVPKRLCVFVAQDDKWQWVDTIYLDSWGCRTPTDIGVWLIDPSAPDAFTVIVHADNEQWTGFRLAAGAASLMGSVRTFAVPETSLQQFDSGRTDNFHWLMRQRQLPEWFDTLINKIKNTTLNHLSEK